MPKKDERAASFGPLRPPFAPAGPEGQKEKHEGRNLRALWWARQDASIARNFLPYNSLAGSEQCKILGGIALAPRNDLHIIVCKGFLDSTGDIILIIQNHN